MARRTLVFVFAAIIGAALFVAAFVAHRTLAVAFGATAQSTASAVAATLAAVAGGGFAGRRLAAESARPRQLSALLGLGAGASALAAPLLAGAVRHAAALAAPGSPAGGLAPTIWLAGALAVVAAPCGLAGAALAAIGAAAERAPRAPEPARGGGGVDSGAGIAVWAAAFAGAGLAALAAPAALVPRLGLLGSSAAAAALAGGAALAALVGSSRERAVAPAAPAEAPAAPASSRGPLAPALAAAAAVGLLGVIASRALVLTLGPSSGAPSLALAGQFLGASLGAAIGARLAESGRGPAWALVAALHAAAALAVIVTIRNLGTLPLFFLSLSAARAGGGDATVTALLLSALVVAPPSALAAAAVSASAHAPDRGAARVMAGALGAAAVGVLLAAALVVPLYGLERGLRVVVALHGLGGLALVAATRPRALPAAGVVAAAALAGAVFLPRWDRYLMRADVSSLTVSRLGTAALLEARDGVDLLFYREGREATISVVDTQRRRVVQVDGRPVASTGKDLVTQVVAGHLPLLLHENPKSVLLLGIGSGVTAGAVGRHPVSAIRCVEKSADAIDAARLFDQANGAALDDPRLAITIADPRAFVGHARESFDVVIARMSERGRIDGAAGCATREAFRLVRARLSPGGVACLVCRLTDLSESDLAILLATFRDTFPHGVLFLTHPGDLLLVGTDREPSLSFDDLVARVEVGRVQSDLSRAGIGSVYGLLAGYVGTFDEIPAFVPPGTPIATDDRPRLDERGRGARRLDATAALIERIAAVQRPVLPLVVGLPGGETGDAVRRAFTEAAAARNFVLQGLRRAASKDMAGAVASLREARRLAPGDRNIAETFAEYAARQGDALAAAGDAAAAAAAFRDAIAALPDDARYPYALARIVAPSDPAAAVRPLLDALRLDPLFHEARRLLAVALAASGDDRSSRHHFDRLMSERPNDAGLHLDRANVAARSGDFPTAMQHYLRCLDLDPHRREARVNLAFAYAQTGNVEKAIEEYSRLHREDPKDVPVLFNLASLVTKAGRRGDAERLWSDLVRLEPNNEEFQRNLAFVRGADASARPPADTGAATAPGGP
jgi:spermidine synthase